jgi:ankyrin repeat protein
MRAPLSYAVDAGDKAIVQLLLDQDQATVDSRDKFGWTPLHYASKGGNEGSIQEWQTVLSPKGTC